MVKNLQLNINFEKCHVSHFLVKKICILIITLIILLFILAFVTKFLVYCLTQICLSRSIYIFQCVSKASRMCNLIYASIKCADMLVLVNLYKCYARPLLEHCSVIFSLRCVYLINLIGYVKKIYQKIAWTAKYVVSG